MESGLAVNNDLDHDFSHFLAKNPRFWIFPWVPLLTHAGRHIGEDFRKFWAKTNDKNWSYQSKTFKKLDFCQKWQFLTLFCQKKSLILNFPMGYHYSHMLKDTYKKTSGSFHSKLMIKIEVISQKPSKQDFWQKIAIFDTFWPKKSNILGFSTGTTTHTR